MNKICFYRFFVFTLQFSFTLNIYFMEKNRCDKCGKEIPQMRKLTVSIKQNDKRFNLKDELTYRLCDRCHNKATLKIINLLSKKTQ